MSFEEQARALDQADIDKRFSEGRPEFVMLRSRKPPPDGAAYIDCVQRHATRD